jgi:hypothetical protein
MYSCSIWIVSDITNKKMKNDLSYSSNHSCKLLILHIIQKQNKTRINSLCRPNRIELYLQNRNVRNGFNKLVTLPYITIQTGIESGQSNEAANLSCCPTLSRGMHKCMCARTTTTDKIGVALQLRLNAFIHSFSSVCILSAPIPMVFVWQK